MSSNRTELFFLASPYPQISKLLEVIKLLPRSKEDVEAKDGRDDPSTSAYQISEKEHIAQGLNNRTLAVVGSAPSETDLLSYGIGIGRVDDDV